MTNSKKLEVSMAVSTCLNPSLDKQVVNLTIYRSMIGSLLYLNTSPRTSSFLCVSVSGINESQKNPIFFYLKGKLSLDLWYLSRTILFVQCFSDADLGGCQLDRKSTSTGCQLLDANLTNFFKIS